MSDVPHDSPESLEGDPPARPNHEERVLSGLRRIAPEMSEEQRCTVVRIFRAWGKWLSPPAPDGLSDGLEEMVWIPRWFLERCPFMSGERMRRCLRFFEGLWSARKLGFNEAIQALAELRALRRDPSNRFAALQYRRAA